MRPPFRRCVIFAPILIAPSLFAQGVQAPLTLSVISASKSAVQLSWTASAPGAPGYIVERKTLDGSYAPLPNIPDAGIPATALTDDTIDAFATYVYRVRAAASGGLPGNEVTVGPPPAGFSVVSPDPSESGHNNEFGRQIQMVLDENGDPAISYLYLLRFVRDEKTSPDDADDFTPTAIYFVSWNRAQYRWNAPVSVALVNDIRVPVPQMSVSLARDATNNTYGLAYAVGFGLDRLDMALSTNGGATWTRQTVVDHTDFAVEEVSLALNGGQGHLAYSRGVRGLGYSTGSQIVAASRWTTTQVPLPPGFTGAARPVLSMALDNSGAPGLAFWAAPTIGNNSVLGYWRPTSLNSVAVTTTNNITNGLVGCDLAFSGAKPRIAMFADLDRVSSWIWVSAASDDGASWAPPANVPQDGALLGNYVSIATGSAGQGALAADVAGGLQARMTCGLPKLARTSDFASWTTCSPTGSAPSQTTAAYMKVAFAPNDSLYLVFQNSNYDLAGVKNGVILWREPLP